MADLVLSKEDEELYDRQIRVWGVDAQVAIKEARVGVAIECERTESGAKATVAAELAKNLCLAGVGHLTLFFYATASSSPSGGENLSFLGKSIEEIKGNLGEMNPSVKIGVASGTLGGIAESLREAKLAIAFGRSLGTACEATEALASGTQASTIFAAGVRGGCGYAFLRKSPSVPTISVADALMFPVNHLPRRVNKLYCVLKVARAYEGRAGRALAMEDCDAMVDIWDREYGEERHKPPRDLFLNYLETISEMPAVSAVVGGSLAQEVIKQISGKGEVMNNFYLFSAYGSKDSGEAKVELIMEKPAPPPPVEPKPQAICEDLDQDPTPAQDDGEIEIL